jgi:DNA-binding NarL/FixJ family response regulator
MLEGIPTIWIASDRQLLIDLLSEALMQRFAVVASPAEAADPGTPIDVAIVWAKGFEGAIQLTRECKQLRPGVSVIVIGAAHQEQEMVDVIEAGACACVPDDLSMSSLLETVEAVRRGESPCSRQIASLVFARLATLARSKQGEEMPSFTSREYELYRLVRTGLSNKEIATELSISVSTVKNHVHQILRKLRIRSRRDAIDWDSRLHRPIHHAVAAGAESLPANKIRIS